MKRRHGTELQGQCLDSYCMWLIHCYWKHPTGVNCLDDRCSKERKILAKLPS